MVNETVDKNANLEEINKQLKGVNEENNDLKERLSIVQVEFTNLNEAISESQKAIELNKHLNYKIENLNSNITQFNNMLSEKESKITSLQESYDLVVEIKDRNNFTLNMLQNDILN